MTKRLLPDKDMYDLALGVAKKAHKNQVDKTGTPYINHPIAVAGMLKSYVYKTVGLLHDVVEDSDYSLNDLENLGFTNEIIEAVDALTKKQDEPRAEYIERVKQNKIALIVKIADATHNSDVTRYKAPTMEQIEKSKKYFDLAQDLKQYLKSILPQNESALYPIEQNESGQE